MAKGDTGVRINEERPFVHLGRMEVIVEAPENLFRNDVEAPHCQSVALRYLKIMNLSNHLMRLYYFGLSL